MRCDATMSGRQGPTPRVFSVAHGGKDLHPFRCRCVYDQTVQVLTSAVQKAKLGERKSSARSNGLMTKLDSSSAMPPAPQCRN